MSGCEHIHYDFLIILLVIIKILHTASFKVTYRLKFTKLLAYNPASVNSNIVFFGLMFDKKIHV